MSEFSGKGHEHGAHLAAVLDPERVLDEIGLHPGNALLDAGSGSGRFTIPAALMVGSEGRVFAVDTSEVRIEKLEETMASQALTNVEAFVADFTQRIPLGDHAADVCLMANVLHELVVDGAIKGELTEIKRVLKPGGVLAVLDFKKNVSRSPGPPLSRRLSRDDVARAVGQYGFDLVRSIEVGPFHYLVILSMTVGAT